ncbi:AMP-binding protein [Candidatus Sumerlaeota bacterium]|nr:AMP-binding protein [Candidatus Sumerlaeota bacterium]
MPQPFLPDCPMRAFSSVEYGSTGEIAALQGRLLSEHVRYAAESSPFYRDLFGQHGVDPEAVRTLDDLASLPCTGKSDLSDRGPDFLAVAPEEVADVCLTSATTGDSPSVLLQTASDLARLAYNEEAAFAMVGVGPGDTMLVCAAIDRCFMAGLAYYLGGLNVGARMVRAGSGSAAQQWRMLKTAKANVLVGVPSLLWRIAEYALENGDDPRRARVKALIAIGEPTRGRDLTLLPATKRLEEVWGARIYSTYASTEVATAFCECPERCGGHLRAELAAVEILDDSGRLVAPGETGEVVVTPFGVRAMPLIRFRTGDVAFLIEEPCACGRRTPRLGPVLGRKSQMLKYKGTTLFPQSILAPLSGRRDVAGAFVEAHRNADGTDRVVVFVAVRDASLTEERLAEELRAALRVVPEIRTIEGGELQRRMLPEGKRKPIVFFDCR